MRESNVREEGEVREGVGEVLLEGLRGRRSPAESPTSRKAAGSSDAESIVNPTIAKDLRFLCSKEFGGETGQYPANLYRRVKRAYDAQPRNQKNPVKAVLLVSEEIRVTRKKGHGWIRPPAKPSVYSRKARRRMGM